ncbi:MAG: hypothetical protein J6R20_01455 [Clostridia bacterium]|nr:hypothetical protein [Clostridia bacterium]
MKRFLSILLAATVMMTSVFCVSAFAAETPKTDALLDRFETEDEVLVTIDSGKTMLFGFLSSDIKNTIAIKDNVVAYEYTAGFIKIRVIASDTGIYAFFPSLPYFYVKLDFNPVAGADIWEFVKDAANLTQGLTQYVDSYTEKVNGKEYYVEEYNDREFVTSKFYYDGDNLVMLNVVDVSTLSVQNTYFDEISFEVEDDFFKIPKGAFDLSPILTGLIISLMAAA